MVRDKGILLLNYRFPHVQAEKLEQLITPGKEIDGFGRNSSYNA